MSVKINLKGYKVNELSIINKYDNAKIQLGNKISYNVKYSNNNICFGNIEAEMFDKQDAEKFKVRISINGMFEYDTALEKEKIHVETFKELYPVAKAIVASTTAGSGMPPVMLPPFDIEGQAIYKFEKNI